MDKDGIVTQNLVNKFERLLNNQNKLNKKDKIKLTKLLVDMEMIYNKIIIENR